MELRKYEGLSVLRAPHDGDIENTESGKSPQCQVGSIMLLPLADHSQRSIGCRKPDPRLVKPCPHPAP